MEVVTLPFDAQANGTWTFMYGRPHSLSIERISVELENGSDYDEISVYALTRSSYWLDEDAPGYSTELKLLSAGESTANLSENGNTIAFFDLPAGITLETLRGDIKPYLVKAYPLKLLSGYKVVSNLNPYVNISTDYKTEAPLRKPTGDPDTVGTPNDLGFIFAPLVGKTKGISVDISYAGAPITAWANSQFSILVRYVNKTSVNKRCKITLYSRAADPDSKVISGALLNPLFEGLSYEWRDGAPGTDYLKATTDTCQYGSLYRPLVVPYELNFVPDPYDYFGGVLDFDNYLLFVPFNAARKANWLAVILSAELPPQFFQYPRGLSSSQFAPAAAYRGGVINSDGLIFFCPYAQASHTAGKWHYFDSASGNLFSYTAPVIPDLVDPTLPAEPGGYTNFPAYCGGALTTTGLLVLAPFGISTAANWHYVDTYNQVVHTYTVLSPPTDPLFYKYAYSNVAGDYIVFCPTRASSAGKWHYFNATSLSTSLYFSVLGPGDISERAYCGMSTVLAPTSISYPIPFAQAARSLWTVIINGTVPSVRVIPMPSGLDANTFVKGILAPTGRLYLIPGFSKGSTVWKYIDYPVDEVSSPKVVSFDNYTPLSDDVTDAAITPWGDIFLIPAFTVGTSPTKFQVIRNFAARGFDSTVVTSPEVNRI